MFRLHAWHLAQVASAARSTCRMPSTGAARPGRKASTAAISIVLQSHVPCGASRSALNDRLQKVCALEQFCSPDALQRVMICDRREPSRSKLISTALRRGLRKRCPHCGEGRLFSGWSQLERCSICGLVFARNPGDTWAFTIIGDRVPIAAMLVLIYFGVVRSHRVLGLTLVVVLVALLVWTAPNRWGAGIALHYLSRVYWPDPRDPIPPPD